MICEEIKEMVAEHVDMHKHLIGIGEVVDYRRIFGPFLLESTTLLEDRYILNRTLSLLVADGEVDLEFAGIDDECNKLYRRIV